MFAVFGLPEHEPIGISEPRIAGSERIFVCLEPGQRFAEERQALRAAKKTLFATTKTPKKLRAQLGLKSGS